MYVFNTGSDSPTSPVKDLATHTRALKLKHQSLEERLERCLLELRKLCIREAVSDLREPSEPRDGVVIISDFNSNFLLLLCLYRS